jgi:hypothetical protein
MEDKDEEFAHSRFQDQHIVLSKYPTRKNQDIKDIIEKHDCPGFLSALTCFINSFNDDALAGGHLRDASLPFNSLDIYHGFRFCFDSLLNDIDVGDKEPDLNLGPVEVLLDLTLWWSWLVMSVNQLA